MACPIGPHTWDAALAATEVAATVADMVLAAIRNNDFWILTHPQWKNVLQERVAGLMNNKLVTGFGG